MLWHLAVISLAHPQHHFPHFLHESIFGLYLLFELIEGAGADVFDLLGYLFAVPVDAAVYLGPLLLCQHSR
jgi:hypothetical protein